jgi:hypothetical protein
MASLAVLKSNSVCVEMLNIQQNFRRENNKGLLFTMDWSGRLLFFVLVLAPHRRCCLCNEVTPTEGKALLATGFYNLQSAI